MEEIRVTTYIRVRPTRHSEPPRELAVTANAIRCGGESYQFCKIFAETHNTTDVYHETVHPLIKQFLSGYNVCVMFFGETDSGKAYTLAGTVNDRNAFFPLAVNDIFRDNTHIIRIEAYEILGDALKDLLSSNESHFNVMSRAGQHLKVNRHDHTAGFVEGLISQAVDNAERCTKAFKMAWENRTMDPSSSRGFNSSHPHAAVVISLVAQDSVKRICSRLMFVKLPCAEGILDRPGTHRGHPSLLRPLRSFRKLVMDLSDVSNQFNVNHGNSKLTQILREALGGNCISCMFVLLKPFNKSDSHLEQLLKCAGHVQDVTNYPIVNTRAAVGLLKLYYGLLDRAEQSRGTTNLANAQAFDEAQDYAKKAYDQMGEIDVLKSRVKELESKLGNMVSECASLEKKLLQSKEELLTVKKGLITTQREVVQQGADNEDELHRKKQELLLLEKQNTELMSDLSRLRMESDTVIGRTEKLQTQRDKANEEYLQLKLKHELLLQEVNNKTGENDELKMQMVSLITSKQALEREMESYKVECSALKARIDGFTAGYQIKQDTAGETHLDNENTSLKQRVYQLETMLNSIQAKSQSKETANTKNMEEAQHVETHAQFNKKLKETNRALEDKLKRLSEEYRSRLERYIQDVTSYISQQSTGPYHQHEVTLLSSFTTEMLHAMAESYTTREEELETSLNKARSWLNDTLLYLNQLTTENDNLRKLLARSGINADLRGSHPPQHIVLREIPELAKASRSHDKLDGLLDTALRKVTHLSHEAPTNFKHHLVELYRQLVRLKGHMLVTRTPVLLNDDHPAGGYSTNYQQQDYHKALQQMEQQNASLLTRCSIAEAQVQELQKYIAKVFNDRTVINK